jgi:hypothetical protein
MVRIVSQKFGSDADVGNRIVSQLNISGLKEMKDDLMSASITGGLKAQIICVRKSHFTDIEQQYADSNHIAVVSKEHLFDDLRRILNPGF